MFLNRTPFLAANHARRGRFELHLIPFTGRRIILTVGDVYDLHRFCSTIEVIKAHADVVVPESLNCDFPGTEPPAQQQIEFNSDANGED